jgi:hypothetical protein
VIGTRTRDLAAGKCKKGDQGRSMRRRPYFGLEVAGVGRSLLVALLKVVLVAAPVPELVVVVFRIVLVPTCERQAMSRCEGRATQSPEEGSASGRKATSKNLALCLML